MSDSVTLTPIPKFIRLVIRFAQFVGLCVLLAAVSVLAGLITYVADAVRMRSWTQGEATIKSVEYAQIEGEAGPQVRARYGYEYDGVAYEGTRVDVADGVELVGNFQLRMADELHAHLANESPATVYINPARPEESVLYPRFYWTVFAIRLALFLMLALFGVAFFWGLGYSLRDYKRRERRRQAHPDEPWLWYANWAEQRIAATGHFNDLILVGLGLCYLLVVLPVALFVLVEWDREITSWPGIVLMVGGLMMFNMTRYGLKKRRRFGRAEFRMSTPTGVIGGALAGVVTIPHRLRTDKPCRVSLECVKKSSSHENKGRHMIEWRTTTLLDQTLVANAPYTTEVPIYLAIDFDCDPWDWGQGRFWRLKVGPDLEAFTDYAEFLVPVFRTADSTPDFEPDPAILRPYVAKLDAERVLGRMYRHEPIAGGVEQLRFSYFDRFAFAVVSVLLGAIVAGIAAIVLFGFHPAWTILPGIFGAVLVFAMCEMLIWGSRIEIRRDDVMVIAGYLPFRKKHVLKRTHVGGRVHVEAYKELQMETRDWYGIRLRIENPEEAVTPQESQLLAGNDEALPSEPVVEHDDEPAHILVEHVTIVRRLNNFAEGEVVREWLEEKLMAAGSPADRLRTLSNQASLSQD